MKDFGTVPRTDGAFPGTTSRADSSPGDKTGTPLHKTLVDSQIAIQEAALRGAHMTPDGATEAVGSADGDIESSQFLQAIQAMFQPAGTIVAWPYDTLPDGARYLKLDGQIILRATYPRLVANVERTFAGAMTAYYRCNAVGTPDAAGTYMKLPDYDGLFLRGRDTAGSVDPDGATRVYSETQAHAVQRHNHVVEDAGTSEYLSNQAVGDVTGATKIPVISGSGAIAEFEASAVNIGTDISAGTFPGIVGVGSVSTETRPSNTVVQWCITY